MFTLKNINSKKEIFFYSTLILVTLILIYFCRDKTFITDDYILLNFVINNPIKNFFIENYFYINYYRPISYLILYFNYFVFRFQPFGYYIINIALHLLSTLLLFKFLILINNELKLSKIYIYVATIVFYIYPQNLTNVFWISARPEIIVFLLVILSLITFIYFIENRKTYYLILSYLIFILSLLVKENAVLIVFYLFLVLLIKKNYLQYQKTIRFILFYLIIIIFYILFRLFILKSEINYFAIENIFSDSHYLVKALLNQFFIFFTPFDLYDFFYFIKAKTLFTILILSLNIFLYSFFFLKVIFLKLYKEFLLIIIGFISFSFYLFIAYPIFRYLYFHTPFIILFFLLTLKKFELKKIIGILFFVFMLIGFGNLLVFRTFTSIKNYNYLRSSIFIENKEKFSNKYIYYLMPAIKRIGHFVIHTSDLNYLSYYYINNNLEWNYNNFYSYPFLEISSIDDISNLVKYKWEDEKSFVIESVSGGLLSSFARSENIIEDNNFYAVSLDKDPIRKDYTKAIKVTIKNYDNVNKIKVIYFEKGKFLVKPLVKFLNDLKTN